MIAAIQSPQKESTFRPHLGFVDGLRALAAIFVLVHHAFFTMPDGRGAWGGRSIYLYGHFAVTMFIVISGFCLMMPVVRNGKLKDGIKGFYLRRARRILPPFYLALGFSFLLALTLIKQHTGTHWDMSIPVTLKGVFANVFMLQDVVGGYQINYVFWSIAVECQIYIWFPLFVIGWQRWGVWRTVGLILVLSYMAAFGVRHTLLVGLQLHLYGMFALGMLGAQIAAGSGAHWQRWQQRFPWLLMSLLLTVGVGYISGPFMHGLNWLLDLPIGLASMGLLIGCTRVGKNPVRDFLSLKPLLTTGTFAYSIYLIHAPLLQVEWQYILRPLHISKELTFALLAGPGMLLIVGISYLFFWYCERPFIPGHPRTIQQSEQAVLVSPAT